MIDEQTDKRPVVNAHDTRTPSEKLILPAVSPSPDTSAEHGHAQHTIAMSSDIHISHPQRAAQHVPPHHKAHSPSGIASNVPYHATVTATWRNDPAYKVLLAAIALVIITGIVFTIYALNVFAQATNQAKTAGTTSQKSSQATAPQGTPNLQPTFPAPGSTAGTPIVGNQPTATTVPTTVPSPTVAATQPPTNGTLTLQITGYPQQVNNNTDVLLTIQANKPGASVQLFVTYNAPPAFYGSAIQQTDANGNATLSWHVRVLMHGGHPITAHVIAVARDQNGHIAQSQMITVQIVSP